MSLALLAQRIPQHHTTRKKKKPPVELVADARSGGVQIWAPSGWGKSVLLGNICHQDALHGTGFVCIDVVGSTIDQALSHLLVLPEREQRAMIKRTRYCRMSGETVGGETFVPAFPLLAKRTQTERLFKTSQRPLSLIRKTDRALSSASIQGLNRLAPLLTCVGIVLAALNEPLSRAYELLEGTTEWQTRITDLAFAQPEAREACLFLLRFFSINEREREVRTEVLRNKLMYKFDPNALAMFDAPSPMIDWEEVSRKGLSVYIDLRGNEPDWITEMKLFTVWESVLEYIKTRHKSDPPFGVVLDEVSYFVRSSNLNTDVIIEELRTLCQVEKRNRNVWLTTATQEQKEIPETMRTALLAMNNQLIGATTEQETAIQNAWRWDYKNLDTQKVKYWQRVWATDTHGMSLHSQHFVIDHTPVFMSLEEQIFEESRKYRSLEKGQWLAALSAGEGVLATKLKRLSTTRFNKKARFDTRLVAKLRRHLMRRDGIPVSGVLSALESRSPQPQQATPQQLQPRVVQEAPPTQQPEEVPPQGSMGRDRGLSG